MAALVQVRDQLETEQLRSRVRIRIGIPSHRLAIATMPYRRLAWIKRPRVDPAQNQPATWFVSESGTAPGRHGPCRTRTRTRGIRVLNDAPLKPLAQHRANTNPVPAIGGKWASGAIVTLKLTASWVNRSAREIAAIGTSWL